jgi:hypothetical protein
MPEDCCQSLPYLTPTFGAWCSLEQALIRGLRVMLLTVAGALAGGMLLRYLESKVGWLFLLPLS